MDLKKLILWLVLTLLTFNVYALSGFVSTSYLEVSPDDRHIPNEHEYVEAGIKESYSISDHLEWRGYLTYVPNVGRDHHLNFDIFLFDIFSSHLGIDYGVRLGRVQNSFGFWGNSRISPETRMGIIPPMTLIWPQFRAMHDYGNGYQVYFYTVFNQWLIGMERGSVEQTDPKPQKNYTVKLNHISSKVAYAEPYYLSLYRENLRLFFTYIKGHQIFNVKKEHWLIDQKVPEDELYLYQEGIGRFTGHYEVLYGGIQYVLKDFVFTFQRFEFWNLRNRNLQRYYDVVNRRWAQFNLNLNLKDSEWREITHNFMIERSYGDFSIALDYGYNFLSSEDSFSPSEKNELIKQSERVLYLKYYLTRDWLLKFDYHDIYGLRYLTANDNPIIHKKGYSSQATGLDKHWFIYGVSLTWMFR